MPSVKCVIYIMSLAPISHFVLLDAYGHAEAAKAIIAAERAEIALYERNRAFVSYGYYVARKIEG